MLTRTLALTSCCVLLLASYAVAEQQTVVLKSGQTVTGDVSRVNGSYRVKTKFGVVTYPGDQVDSVGPAKDLQKEYKDQQAKVGEDPQRHVKLAQWALDNGALDIAQTELESALKVAPADDRATKMLRLTKRRMDEQRENAAALSVPVTTPPAGQATATQPQAKNEYVSDDDIAKIRLYELKKDENVAVGYRNAKVLDKFIAKMKGTSGFEENRFRTWSVNQQVQYMLTQLDQDDAMRLDIVVKQDPKVIKDFRSIWPTIGQNCGQLKCHGGPAGKGELKLFNVPGPNEKADYSNFLILSLWEKNGRQLIDRSHPKDSLLLQYGLPADVAKFSHPGNIQAIFTSDKAVQYRRIEDWIESLAGSTQPDYRTTYQPTVGRKLGGGGSSLLNQPTTGPAKEAPDPFKGK